MTADWHSIPGWWSDACAAFYRQCVDEAPPRAHFVEVGSWQGRSAATMALAIRDARLRLTRPGGLALATAGADARFDCVDTWLGTPAEGDAGHHQRLIREGGLNIREEFERNLRVLGLREYVNPVTGDSAEAAATYPDSSLDLVFIDGDHRTEMVERDCRAWRPKLRYGGILAGHDADAERVISGVLRAGVTPTVKGQIWSWRKRLPVWVDPEVGVLTAGVLLGGERVAHWFGESIATEAVEVLPRYFELIERERADLSIADCGAFSRLDCPENLRLCPCDEHPPLDTAFAHRSILRRSARDRYDPTFPAFPHGQGDPWPFLSQVWEPPAPTDRYSIGFCGVMKRPEIRCLAIDALLNGSAAGKFSVRLIDREQFLGLEVGREKARADFLRTLLDCPYQLCVRGVGNYCYRLYETLAAGRVPVLVDTDRSLPWREELPWEQMAVIVPADDLESLPERVRAHREERDPTSQGVVNRRLWWEYLSPVGWWREWARSTP